jgi:NAD(P)-dependent dehydrogenase (short-subunit alcohol dehydrogenase family)
MKRSRACSYPKRARSSLKPLGGRVALVAGATRGAGRGIARALGEAGAIVYRTGRSVTGNPSPYGRPETINETAAMIKAAGGSAIAVRVDHTIEDAVKALFRRILRAHKRVDIVVDSVAGEDPLFTDYDGRRPDWGRHKIDFSVLPPEWTDLFRTGIALELEWLTTLSARTKQFKAKIPR